MDNFNLQGYIASGKLHAKSKTLTEAKHFVKKTINPRYRKPLVLPKDESLDVIKKEVKKTRSQKIRAKGEAALASGNKKEALRLRRRLDRVDARVKKRADRKAKK